MWSAWYQCSLEMLFSQKMICIKEVKIIECVVKGKEKKRKFMNKRSTSDAKKK